MSSCLLFENHERPSLEDFKWAVSSRALNAEKLINFLGGALTFDKVLGSWTHCHEPQRGDKLRESLRALVTIADVYEHISGLTIALKAICTPLSGKLWCHSALNLEQEEGYSDSEPIFLRGLKPFALTRGETFALLATLESGELDPNPESLESVMAMSSGDSIYASALLLMDPVESRGVAPSAIRRIRGNIGKAGIA